MLASYYYYLRTIEGHVHIRILKNLQDAARVLEIWRNIHHPVYVGEIDSLAFITMRGARMTELLLREILSSGNESLDLPYERGMKGTAKA